jgi:hypothetical protein
MLCLESAKGTTLLTVCGREGRYYLDGDKVSLQLLVIRYIYAAVIICTAFGSDVCDLPLYIM